jgi:hypothetical protein
MDEDKGDTIKINTAEMKKGFGTVVDFFKNKKVQKILIIVLLLSVIILGVWIRTQNIDILIDQTTGKHIPTALDPFYFLRLTETILEQGGYPEFDTMRYLPNIILFSCLSLNRLKNNCINQLYIFNYTASISL